MIEIGHMPILWLIVKIYAVHGIREFVLILGYIGKIINDFFINSILKDLGTSIDSRFYNIGIFSKE